MFLAHATNYQNGFKDQVFDANTQIFVIDVALLNIWAVCPVTYTALNLYFSLKLLLQLFSIECLYLPKAMGLNPQPLCYAIATCY